MKRDGGLTSTSPAGRNRGDVLSVIDEGDENSGGDEPKVSRQ